MLQFYLTIAESGERGKFEQLYRRYKSIMLSCAYSILKDEGMAEDAVHNAFMRILNNLSKLDEVESPRTRAFVLVVTENAAKSLYSKLNRVKVVEFDENVPTAATVEKSVESTLTAEFIAQKIAELPEKYSRVMLLRYYNNLNDKEIASVLGISAPAVRKRLERGRKQLGDLLGGLINE